MKKFKFKLESLKKMRELKEKQIKIELGKIVKQTYDVKVEIQKLERDIEIGYESQEGLVTKTVGARFIGFYPLYIEGIKAKIKTKNDELSLLEKEYELKVEQLKQARGKVKVLERFEEKEFAHYKKESKKKELMTIEDLIRMRGNL
ncbi:MAG: flagellar FliJ family protein [Bacteriovoracaceae bacterium]|nr:flagellar FliJ family protein [Bacteriovoracaceae bacterium]